MRNQIGTEAGRRPGAKWGVLVLMFLGGCASAGSDAPNPLKEIPGTFSNADWGKVLSAVTTPDGYVKWDLLRNNTNEIRQPLMNFIGLLNAVSPENHAELFATDQDRLAYWINAFNATCMYAVVEHGYPGSMLAGNPPGAMFSVEEFVFGGHHLTLNDLVERKLRPAGDARVYFALNFCARSSAPLRSSPYDGAVLDAELVDQGQRYLSDPRAAVRDGDDVVKLNDLLIAMHQADFLASFEKLIGRKPTGILEALQPYVQNDSPIVGASKVGKLGFDWTLNRPPR